MYKAFNADDFRQHFGFPEDYCVSGLISYGAWDEEKHFNTLHTTLDKLDVAYSSKKLSGFLSHIYEVTINNKIYWFSLLYGGTMLSEYIHIACLFGSEKNIHIGSCGGLYPQAEALDFIIPNYSYGDESTTRIYQREVIDNKHWADENLNKSLEKNLKTNRKVWSGPVMTCQAMLGETMEDVASWSKEGYYGVEMEVSAVLAVSKHFSVPAAALLYIADNLIQGKTVWDQEHVDLAELREKSKLDMCRVAILSLLKNN